MYAFARESSMRRVSAANEQQCGRCGSVEESREQLEAHVASVHLDWKPYQCVYCKYAWLPTEPTLREHCQSIHPDKPLMILFKPDDAKKLEMLQILSQSTSKTLREKIAPHVPFASPVFYPSPWTASLSGRPLSTVSEVNLVGEGSQPGDEIASRPSFGTPDPAASLSTANTTDRSADSRASLTAKVLAPPPLIEGKVEQKPIVLDMEAEDVKPAAHTGGLCCAVCDAAVAIGDERKHIYRRHIRRKLIQCPHCSQRRSWFANLMRQHISQKHNSTTAPVDLRQTAGRELERHLAKCFPARNKPIPADAVLETALKHEAPSCSLCAAAVLPPDRWAHVWRCHLGIAADCTAAKNEYQKSEAARLHVLCFAHDSKPLSALLADSKDMKAEVGSDSDEVTELSPTVQKCAKEESVGNAPAVAAATVAAPSAAVASKGNESDADEHTQASDSADNATPDEPSTPSVCCSLCNASVVRKHTAAHVWAKHMDEQSFQCLYCAYECFYRCNITAHLAKRHPKLTADFKDETERLGPQLLDLKRQCFGAEAVVTRKRKARKSVAAAASANVGARWSGRECRLCAETVYQTNSHVYSHILEETKRPRFTCGYSNCQFESALKMAMNTHILHQHGVKGNRIGRLLLDHADEMQQTFDRFKTLCGFD